MMRKSVQLFKYLCLEFFLNQHTNNDAYIFKRNASIYILSDSGEKTKLKSNTKEFQSTRDPREFKVSLLLYQLTVC